jgi:hypothetical protein
MLPRSKKFSSTGRRVEGGAATREVSVRHRILVSVLGLVVLLGGCSQLYYVRPGTLAPGTSTVAPGRRAAAWHHAIAVLLDQGYVPNTLDEPAGYIRARRREDLADDALKGTVAIVLIAPNGAVRVQLSGTGWFRSEKDFLDAIGQRQALLLRLISSVPDAAPAQAVPGSPAGN